MSEYVICQINYCDKQRYSLGGWKVALNLFRIRIRFWMLFENHLEYYFVVIVLLVVIPETKVLIFFKILLVASCGSCYFSCSNCLINLYLKGVVSSYQIELILPSVVETDPKTNQSRCNLQFSICRHAGGKVLRLENHHSLF